MKKHYFLSLFVTLCSLQINAQTEAYFSQALGTSIRSINNNGLGLSAVKYFDYNTKVYTIAETALGISQLNTINDNGDITGEMKISGTSNKVPAFKTKTNDWKQIGVFQDFVFGKSTFTVFDYSENGKYIVGQMSKRINNKDIYGSFIYYTKTGELRPIFNEKYLALAVYTINDEGLMAGWVDDEGNNGGTRRIPCLIDQDLKITYIDETLPKSAVSDIMKINVNGLMAGEWEGLPMVYNHKTGERKSIKIYDGFYAGAFEDISDNGIAVGYMTTMNSANQLVREAVIWHESFGDQVQLLSDYVKKAGFSIDTYDGMMGTALTISNNGKYIGGYDNSAFNFGRGWVVKLSEKLLNTNESIKYTSNINVYPTLVTSTLNISSDYIINQYTITTIDGKVVKKSNLNNIKEKIEVSSLSKGIYIITINSNHTTKSVKFIKQ